MDGFTPLSRRFIALGLLALAVLIGVRWLAIPLIAANGAALQDLAKVRRALARLQAQASGPEIAAINPFPSRAVLWAVDRKAGSAKLNGHLAALAAGSNIELQILPGVHGGAGAPSLITIGFSATGAREDVIRFISALETGVPQARFRRFNLDRVEVGPSVTQPPIATSPMLGAPPTASVAAETNVARIRLDAEVVVLWGGAL